MIFVKKDLDRKLSNFKIHKIVHLAAQAGVRNAYDYPRTHFQSNLLGFFNIIEFARGRKIKELLCASTSSIYGDQKISFKKYKHQIQFSFMLQQKSNEVMGYGYNKMFNINLCL